jgi:hypothetical protein
MLMAQRFPTGRGFSQYRTLGLTVKNAPSSFAIVVAAFSILMRGCVVMYWYVPLPLTVRHHTAWGTNQDGKGKVHMKIFCAISLVLCWSVSPVVRAFRQQRFIARHSRSRCLWAKHGDLVYPDPPLPNFCADCGSSNMIIRVPDGDERPRACCGDCNAIV